MSILLGTAPPGHKGAPLHVWRFSGYRYCKVHDFCNSCILQRLLGRTWNHKVFDFGHSLYLLSCL